MHSIISRASCTPPAGLRSGMRPIACEMAPKFRLKYKRVRHKKRGRRPLRQRPHSCLQGVCLSAVTVTSSSPPVNTRDLTLFQPFSPEFECQVGAFGKSLSVARFSRYRNACEGNDKDAAYLYHLNGRLSQSLYLKIQHWEVALRNRMHVYLAWKFGRAWPYDERFDRQLKRAEKRRLGKTKERLEDTRGIRASTDKIVADLSIGFWVGLLSAGYEVPLTWKHKLREIFPNAGNLDRKTIHEQCDNLADLRNRIAHHEPIFHLDLVKSHRDLEAHIAWMCAATSSFASHSCTFAVTNTEFERFLASRAAKEAATHDAPEA